MLMVTRVALVSLAIVPASVAIDEGEGVPPVVSSRQLRGERQQSHSEEADHPSDFAVATSAADPRNYHCYQPLNCYAGHGADEIDVMDIDQGAPASACADFCDADCACEGFVYMHSQQKCWRRRNIHLSECQRGRRRQENMEFMTCIKRSAPRPSRRRRVWAARLDEEELAASNPKLLEEDTNESSEREEPGESPANEEPGEVPQEQPEAAAEEAKQAAEELLANESALHESALLAVNHQWHDSEVHLKHEPSDIMVSSRDTQMYGYSCYRPLNCYRGHGADDIDDHDINRGDAPSTCASSCNSDCDCDGFVYMASQKKCWRRKNLELADCERGHYGQESAQFMTCVKREARFIDHGR